MASLTPKEANLAGRLAQETELSPSYCIKCLRAVDWNYNLALENIINLRRIRDKKIMTMEDKIELILLNSVLDDRFYCNQLRHETLGKLLVRHKLLLDEFVKQYELPNSNNGPVMEP